MTASVQIRSVAEATGQAVDTHFGEQPTFSPPIIGA
jgi:hypothetical protein